MARSAMGEALTRFRGVPSTPRGTVMNCPLLFKRYVSPALPKSNWFITFSRMPIWMTPQTSPLKTLFSSMIGEEINKKGLLEFLLISTSVIKLLPALASL
ncbi:hypothetical protein D3C71_1893270 [compost metagenome]